ncbi:hypothetical protein BKA70DRAFT_1451185 [Coprinopsis sp. MPI-PUGE-AT-0042]|nr:hypothetical protein BKA70DRAFT_1451185 [Coprinopsis sp. MPI-PUGE-AT-0042]
MKIMIKSPVIYTAGVLVMVALVVLDHPARFALQSCMMPTIGIVLVLMALRTHVVQEESKQARATAPLMPTRLVDEPNATESRQGSAEDE